MASGSDNSDLILRQAHPPFLFDYIFVAVHACLWIMFKQNRAIFEHE